MVAIIDIVLILYIFILLGIGAYFFITSETKRLSDYMLAGRNLGAIPIGISEAASLASGWVFFAWVGVGFTTGLGGLWYALALVPMYLFVWRFIAPKFRRQSEEHDSQTIVDHLSLHYENTQYGSWIRLVGTIVVLVFLVAYIGAQVIAVGEGLDTGLGVNYTFAIVVGGITVGIYTSLGGLNASVWTDFFQGLLVIFGLLTLPVMMILEIGGLSAFFAEARAIDPTLVSLNDGLGGLGLFLFAFTWWAHSIGALGQPHGLMRYQAIRSEGIVSRASVVALLFQTLRMTVPLFIGIAGRILYDNAAVAEPEIVGIMAIIDFFPAAIAGLLIAAVLGVILSTTDSMLIVLGADITRFYESFFDPDMDDRKAILLGRGVVIAVSLLGILIAAINPGTIFTVIQFAWVGLGASFGVSLAAILWWDQITAEGVLATMVAGLLSTVGNQLLFPAYFPLFVPPITVASTIIVTYLTDTEAEPVTEPVTQD
jgi:sodium/proline symporter